MNSFLEASARQRIEHILDPGTFRELLPPEVRMTSPHLAQLDLPVAFDDGVITGEGLLGGNKVLIASQEGRFMGGAVGEVHGAKIVGLSKRAVRQNCAALILLLDTGGVRLHEANAGLIAVSEVMRAILTVRAAGIPVITLIGGSNGCFGGMGIVAKCTNFVVMSEEARLGMSGPEVIETANGVEEFDSRDRALVWRTTGGKHRYIMNDADEIVPDRMDAFRDAAIGAISAYRNGKMAAELTHETLGDEHALLQARIDKYGGMADSTAIWTAVGIDDAATLPLCDIDRFLERVNRVR
jgi:malonate decarboxylase beta subunit